MSAYTENFNVSSSDSSDENDNNTWLPVEKIIGRRIPINTGEIEYLVRWKGYSKEYDTWEPISNICHLYQFIRDYEKRAKSKRISENSKVTAKPKDDLDNEQLLINLEKNVDNLKVNNNEEKLSPTYDTLEDFLINENEDPPIRKQIEKQNSNIEEKLSPKSITEEDSNIYSMEKSPINIHNEENNSSKNVEVTNIPKNEEHEHQAKEIIKVNENIDLLAANMENISSDEGEMLNNIELAAKNKKKELTVLTPIPQTLEYEKQSFISCNNDDLQELRTTYDFSSDKVSQSQQQSDQIKLTLKRKKSFNDKPNPQTDNKWSIEQSNNSNDSSSNFSKTDNAYVEKISETIVKIRQPSSSPNFKTKSVNLTTQSIYDFADEPDEILTQLPLKTKKFVEDKSTSKLGKRKYKKKIDVKKKSPVKFTENNCNQKLKLTTIEKMDNLNVKRKKYTKKGKGNKNESKTKKCVKVSERTSKLDSRVVKNNSKNIIGKLKQNKKSITHNSQIMSNNNISKEVICCQISEKTDGDKRSSTDSLFLSCSPEANNIFLDLNTSVVKERKRNVKRKINDEIYCEKILKIFKQCRVVSVTLSKFSHYELEIAQKIGEKVTEFSEINNLICEKIENLSNCMKICSTIFDSHIMMVRKRRHFTLQFKFNLNKHLRKTAEVISKVVLYLGKRYSNDTISSIKPSFIDEILLNSYKISSYSAEECFYNFGPPIHGLNRLDIFVSDKCPQIDIIFYAASITANK